MWEGEREQRQVLDNISLPTVPMDIYVIDGDNFTDFDSFTKEFTRVLCSQFGANWRGHLDAFNDFLYWPERPYVLVWKSVERSRAALGHGEMVKWLEERIKNCHPTGVPHFQERLDAARAGQGPTMFDFLVEIIRDNEEFVELRLE